ncbi:MAG: LysR family transcriptional regulator, partial [Alphaproteobacteria bacterium]|nr:LysR family transcriptional regulator [Alphaproteobacteria bacterium]
MGCQLFDRPAQGEAHRSGRDFPWLLKRIIQLQWEAYSRLREPDVRRQIRLGTPEDFATHYYPRFFRPSSTIRVVQLNVSCDLTLNLIDGFRRGDYDVILVKRDPKATKGGTKVWLNLWYGQLPITTPEEPLSLVLSPQPCIYRARALVALDKAKAVAIAYTSPSLAGTIAAAKAGLGNTVLPANM